MRKVNQELIDTHSVGKHIPHFFRIEIWFATASCLKDIKNLWKEPRIISVPTKLVHTMKAVPQEAAYVARRELLCKPVTGVNSS